VSRGTGGFAHRLTFGLIALAVLCAAVFSPRTLSAQESRIRLQPELRLDGIIADSLSALQLGAGAEIPVGYYVRIGVIGAAGVPLGGSDRGVGGRLDLLGRFLLDPFRQSRIGLSVGGGVSIRAEHGERVRPLILAVLDLEGRRSSSGLVPALQLGLGGGVRIGAVLRWASARTR
jgi:hypothetical protein